MVVGALCKDGPIHYHLKEYSGINNEWVCDTILRVRNLEAFLSFVTTSRLVLLFASLTGCWPGERDVSSSYTDKRDI